MKRERLAMGSGIAWTQKEERELLRLHKAGVNVKDIGRKLKRGWSAVASKVTRMRKAGEEMADQRRKNALPFRTASPAVSKPVSPPAPPAKVAPTTLEERAVVGLRALGWHVRDVAFAMDRSFPDTVSMLEALGV